MNFSSEIFLLCVYFSIPLPKSQYKRRNFKINLLIKASFCDKIFANEVKTMSIDKAIENSAASVEMEGFSIDEQCKNWCRQLLQGELTMEEYIVLVKQRIGVPA